jgi:hypothetical protein
MNGLRTFDPRVLLGDRPELTLYRMFVEAYLRGDYKHEADLYARFIKHFPGEKKVHSPDQFIGLIESIRQKGFDWRYPIHANPKEYTLCMGSHRCAIAMALGMTEVPYITRFHDDWVGDNDFRRILGERDFEIIRTKRDEYLSMCPPDMRLKCWLRLHMRNNPGSFVAPFSSPNALKVLRPYQAFEVLEIPGKRPSAKRIELYGLLKYVDKSTKVLDIGCNVGFFGLTLAPHVGSLLGIDVDPNYIAVAQRFREYCGITNARFICTSVSDFRANAVYDLIISTAVHGWLGMPFGRYISMIAQWAGPSGILLIESHELDAHRWDWARKRDFLLANFDVLQEGLIDDVDTSIYESEYRNFLILRKRERWRYDELYFEDEPVLVAMPVNEDYLKPNLKAAFRQVVTSLWILAKNLVKLALYPFPVRFKLAIVGFLSKFRGAVGRRGPNV